MVIGRTEGWTDGRTDGRTGAWQADETGTHLFKEIRNLIKARPKTRPTDAATILAGSGGYVAARLFLGLSKYSDNFKPQISTIFTNIRRTYGRTCPHLKRETI